MTTNDLSRFGEWLKARRRALDLTQKELAYAAGCSMSAIRKMEAGQRRPSRQVAELLADHLEIEPEERERFILFAREEPAPGGSQVTPFATQSAPNAVGAASTPTRTPNNLPAFLTAFIGRDDLVGAVVHLLWRVDVRWLTLTGPPGTGKTRLSVQVADSLSGDFSDGVFFVPLAAFTDPLLVLPSVARALGVRESAGLTLLESLKLGLRDRNILLVLDNFEQVAEAGPAFGELLQSSPRLKVLATSRVPLHLYGEHEFPVPPMDVPGVGESGADPTALAEVESVELFLRRAQAVSAGFTLHRTNSASVAEICRLLEGLPLAIELAAARIRYMDSATLLSLLHRKGRMNVLLGETRDLTPRQRTLRGAIAWSYDLLSDVEQRLFRQAGVFAGGFTLQAAAHIWEALPSDHGTAVLDAALDLADKSLLRQERYDEEPRFDMLEAIREYALEKLSASGEEGAVRSRHAHYFLDLAQQFNSAVGTQVERVWLEKLAAERGNMIAALYFMLEESKRGGEGPTLLLRLVNALSHFWYVQGPTSEGRHWLETAITIQGSLDQLLNLEDGEEKRTAQELRGMAQNELGTLCWLQGDFPAARASYSAAFVISKQMGQKLGIAKSLNNLGNVANEQGDLEAARRYYEESLVLAQELGAQTGITRLLNNLGTVAHKQGDYSGALSYYEGSLEIRRTLGDEQGIALTLNNLGVLLSYMGKYRQAWELHSEALMIGRELGSGAIVARSLLGLGDTALGEGDALEAQRNYRESLKLDKEVNYTLGVAESIEGLARAAIVLTEPEKAAFLCGLAENLRAQISAPRGAMDVSHMDLAERAAREALGDVLWNTHWSRGFSTPHEDVLAVALTF